MYRLLCIQNISQNNFKVILKNYVNLSNELKNYRNSFTLVSHAKYELNSLNNFNKNESQFLPLKLQIRDQSTHPDILRLTKKKKKRKIKKFTELLQVTDKSTKETKASIQNLKASQLTNFINKSKISSRTTTHPPASNLEYNKYNFDQFHNIELGDKIYDEIPVLVIHKNADISKYRSSTDVIKEIVESCQTFKEMTLSESEIDIPLPRAGISSSIMEDESLYLEEEVDPLIDEIIETGHSTKETSKSIVNATKISKQSCYKSKYHISPELEKQSKQHSFSANLEAYLELCVNVGMISRGFSVLLNYRLKANKTPYNKVRDIKLYNILLHGYAGNGNITKVREILSILKEDGIVLIPQTYAAIFECIGRLPDNLENNKLLHKTYSEMKEKGITLNDVIDKSKFIADQREIILEAIEKIDPSFKPNYTIPILTYNNTLLNNLNKNVLTLEDSQNENAVKSPSVMNAKHGFTVDQLNEMCQEQLKIELDGYVTVNSIEKFPEPTEHVSNYRKKLAESQELWRSQIRTAFQRDLNTLRHQTNSKCNRTINIYPYLKSLDIQQFTDILLREIRTLAEGSETFSPTIGFLYRELGNKAQMKYQMELKKRNGILEKTDEIYNLYCQTLAKCNENDNPRQAWQRTLHNNRNAGPCLNNYDKPWPMPVMAGVGRFLYNILMRDVKIDTNIMRTNAKIQNHMSAFYTLFRNQGKWVKEEVKPHPILSRLFRGAQQQTLLFDANMVPMLCPPQPWTTPVNGGYIATNSDLIRLPHQAIQQTMRINEASVQDLYPSLDSLNQLSSIPWKVHHELLDVILTVFKNGGDSKLDIPQPPSSLNPPQTTLNSSLTKQEKYQIYRDKLLHKRKQSEMYSLWCDCLYRLSLANHFRDRVFWLPHNMDFRGRVYPIPPHLNHLGSDLARSLLIFQQPQKLGPDGFNWLKLHCVNLTGLKKRDSIVERLLYAEEVMDDILDSADKPLTGRKWWTKSDEPWQTLGCCMEIAKVLRSGDPENFMSCLPIHQDGSCNGLQHYAALGRDAVGAASVNLAPANVPQDVYSAVANLVEEARLRDVASGIQVAKMLDGFIKRKVIKQTVMTTVYGVTRYGARLQIARQLKDIDEFPKDWVWPSSRYLTSKTFESLREMFTSTKEIQDWFTDCARLISAVCGQNVEWVTPLGLPVVQPYNRQEHKTLKKSNNCNEHVTTDLYEKPNVMKQKNAFPPNFIHSLDSSHMMLTALHCERAGLTFISVHDCFWTHACTVGQMNKICREQFVALHSQPILENLSNFLIKKYSYSDRDFDDDGSVSELSKRKLNKTITKLPPRVEQENCLKVRCGSSSQHIKDG